MNSKAIRWVLSNFLFAFCLGLATLHEVEGAMNLVTFIVWFMFVIACLLMVPAVREAIVTNTKPDWKRSVPAGLDVTFDVAVVGFLVWHGMFVLGSLYLFANIVGWSLMAEQEEFLAKPKEKITLK